MQDVNIDPAFKTLIGMGEVKKVYKPNRISTLSEIFSFLFMTAGGLLMVYYVPILYRRDQGISIEMIMFVLGAPSFVGIGFYFLWRVIYWWNDTAVVYQNGFAYLQRKGIVTFLWNEIISIRMEAANFRALGIIPAGKARDYRIANSSAQLRLASTLNQVDDLMAEIGKNTFSPRLARLKQEFDSGRSVQFGSITISKQGVQWKDRNYPWKDLAQAGIAEGTVHFSPKDRKLFGGIHVVVREVTDFDVLLALSNDMIRQHG
jgi:hypothetical protein